MTGTTNRPLLWRRLVAEFLGTGLLVAIVVGSGIMASRLSTGDVGLQLLENSIATGLGLAVLILVLAPVSGAHFNPVVSIVDLLGRGQRPLDPIAYIGLQVIGGIGGAILANAMFGVSTTIATADRIGLGTALGEVVATAGLVLVIFGLDRTGRPGLVAPAVGAYIGAAYWFTSSTSFANPAVTIGRTFSDTFAGVAPTSALGFIAAQLVGGAIGLTITTALFPRTTTRTEHP
ncbi:MAG: aquaporin family protein [Microbacteriaceae bacterium]|nr:aquaporin family protein [Microbacteriaceae bacterium]